jgi:hypothetical protein
MRRFRRWLQPRYQASGWVRLAVVGILAAISMGVAWLTVTLTVGHGWLEAMVLVVWVLFGAGLFTWLVGPSADDDSYV